MADFGGWNADARSANGLMQSTPNATAHVKGSWATQSGGAPSRADGFYLSPAWIGSSGTRRTVLVDIGFGSGPTVLINNLMLCPPSANYLTLPRCIAQQVYFPVSAPPSELFKARSQASSASHQDIYMQVMQMSSGMPCVGSVVDTYGADTANTKGTTLTAPNTEGSFGSWVQLSSSCERVKAIIVAVGHGQANWSTYSDQWIILEIGIGASSSELTICRIEDVASSSGTDIASQNWVGPYYVDIPSGTRISARVAKQYSSSSQRTVDVVLYGIR